MSTIPGAVNAEFRKRSERLPAAATRSESLRLQIEDDILSGRMTPGQKLDEEALGSHYGLSRTPVREALKALTSSGLVEVRPHQGAYVASPTLASIVEMFEVMALFEVACAELASRRHNASDRAALLAAQAECERPGVVAEPSLFYAANVRFHGTIHRAAHNGFLSDQTRALRLRLEPYRHRISYHPGTIDKAIREHRVIVDAILAMDVSRAADAMKSHLAALRDDVATLVQSIQPIPPSLSPKRVRSARI